MRGLSGRREELVDEGDEGKEAVILEAGVVRSPLIPDSREEAS